MPIMVVGEDGHQRGTLTIQDLINKLKIIQLRFKGKDIPVLIRYESISGWRITGAEFNEADDEVPDCAILYMEE